MKKKCVAAIVLLLASWVGLHAAETKLARPNIMAMDIKPAERIELFNGKDLTGWVSTLQDNIAASKVWSVQDGTLRCSGEPFGYLRTEKTWTDYHLTIEWRWMTDKAGNSGLFLHMNGPDKIWPKTFECQGAHGHQGDVFCLGVQAVEMPAKGGLKSMDAAAEKPIGEWNTYEAICKGDTITVILNGTEVNRLSGCVPSSGAVGLQSEHGAWEVRRVTIKPLLTNNSSMLEAPPLKVLIVDGQNNHDWKATTPMLKWILEDCGRFAVDVSTTPPSAPNAPRLPKDATAQQQADHEAAMAKWKVEKAEFKQANVESWKQWRPTFGNYNVIVMNYTGDRWPDEVRDSFTQYVQKGGGLVIYHAADNAFSDWPEFNEMIGVGGWGGRNEKSGPMIRWRDGKIVRDETPGPGGTHGPAREFVVEIRDPEHPITKGLPTRWMHSFDELYSKLRGPAKNLTVLATAFADPAKQGTGEHEPMLMTINYGQGRIFHDALGHEPRSMVDVGFIATLQRGTEWAATGKVTLPPPNPEEMSADRVVVRPLP